MIRVLNYIFGVIIRFIASRIQNACTGFSSDYETVKREVKRIIRRHENLPAILINAVIQIEDKRFFQHQGVDLYAIIRACFNNLHNERIQGASTIAQQLARNMTNDRAISFRRKMREIIIASLLSRDFLKGEIMSAYLASYPFGGNITGVKKLCESELYDAKYLSIGEAASIAARLKYPQITTANLRHFRTRVKIIEQKIKECSGQGEKINRHLKLLPG